jgi:hypothetical protein
VMTRNRTRPSHGNHSLVLGVVLIPKALIVPASRKPLSAAEAIAFSI